MTKSILAIETCSETCSVALVHGDKQNQLLSDEPRGHADNVLPMIDKLLSSAQLSLDQLDAIAFTRGPGAFTGVRIGTSVAQGLAVGANLPVIAVSSLQVLAQGSYREEGISRCLAALDARMSEVYFGAYELNEHKLMIAVQDEQVNSGENIVCVNEQKAIAEQNSWQARGPGWNNYIDEMKSRFSQWNINFPEQIIYPQAIDLLTLAQWQFANGDLLDPEHALPVYVRDQVVRQQN